MLISPGQIRPLFEISDGWVRFSPLRLYIERRISKFFYEISPFDGGFWRRNVYASRETKTQSLWGGSGRWVETEHFGLPNGARQNRESSGEGFLICFYWLLPVAPCGIFAKFFWCGEWLFDDAGKKKFNLLSI